MPIVNIELWKGKTAEQKAELARTITDNIIKIFNSKPESIQIIFHEVDKENWAIGGKIQGIL